MVARMVKIGASPVGWDGCEGRPGTVVRVEGPHAYVLVWGLGHLWIRLERLEVVG